MAVAGVGELDDVDRQIVAWALADLADARPGAGAAIRLIAEKLGAADAFDRFRRTPSYRIERAPHPAPQGP
jgi:hypothetical protein